MTDTDSIPVEDWRVRDARIEEKLRHLKENRRSPRPSTLIDAARALCDVDAPPPTAEELIWLKEKLSEHQQSVERLIQLIEALLDSSTSGDTHHLDDQKCDRKHLYQRDRTFEEE
ncbi:MAG: hypothetical protein F6K28_52555 [Microcoleus sp. SIO2G3]|nr:hypothetical protein [Microcoleus sp. SIO2G3]